MGRRSVMMEGMELDGWKSWMRSPPTATYVRAYRIGWDTPHIIAPAELPPEYNVAGLYWQSIEDRAPAKPSQD